MAEHDGGRPGCLEAEHAGQVVEQVVRPTGLLDPEIEVRPASTQVYDLLSEIHSRVKVKPGSVCSGSGSASCRLPTFSSRTPSWQPLDDPPGGGDPGSYG